MKDEYDVVVVGAGPAGSIAAKNAALKGLDVLLIEKRQEIGDPVRCAEGAGKFNLKQHIEPDPQWICADLTGSRIYSPDGTMIEMAEEVAGGEVGYVLERKVFDRALAQEAARAGAEVQVKTRATGLVIEDGFVTGINVMRIGEEHTIKTKIVIAADGVESKVARWAGIDTTLKLEDIETCTQYLVVDKDINQNYCHFYLGNEIAPSGYIWIFPKGNDKANVGIGILGSEVTEDMRPVDYLDTFIENKFPNAKIIEMVVGGVPVSGSIHKSYTNGLMVVGDAARQSDPITGGGIINAMDAGKIAGEVAAEAVKVGDYSENMLKEYETRWKSIIGKEIDCSLIVKNNFVHFTDKQLNSLAYSLKDVNFTSMSLMDLLFALFKANKKLLWDLRVIFKDVVKNDIDFKYRSEVKSSK
ncbi:NAD(P)/FAD-dependent oxidoreductase [Methanosalsum natronophilum]|uniref:Digeranylgeranylglycerophospholipid reductase n=1 Tax=Methanosalsum natronophilum TaxID=768733 RepID=A0A424YTH3_9EURY|nr:NAD(P)/FAD-dependent oxidoreductase [Methanosalsum natronophilum]MCS3923210.1 digeranylgeranylglycerophospholipid reductase [Methanosalsum natronophilum]RQD82241.1 MAG: NAD(P)/FAD-dependent oxidoreductase [Methanosalsum natronophilum]